MGGKSGGAQKAEAERARAEEEARQQRVRQGTSDINKIFDGGSFGSGRITDAGAFDPNAAYYKADGSRWTPTAVSTVANPIASANKNTAVNVRYANGGYGGIAKGGRVDGPAGRAILGQANPGKSAAEQFAEMVASGGLYSGVERKGGFDDTFFRSIRDNYTNYAIPQLTEQRDKAAKDLTFSLARAGQLDGSVRGQKSGELQKLFDLNEQQVRDQALAYENQARNNVENARADLIGTLNATGDNQQAVNSALSRATILTQPQAYSPLGQLFTDFTAQLGNQAARERAAAASGGAYKPAFNTGWFGGKGDVVTRY